MKITFIIIINFLFFFQNIYSQVTIEGKIKSKDNNIVDGVYLVIFENNNYSEHCFSDLLGSFNFKKVYNTGVYKIEASHLGFKKYSQLIYVTTDSPKKINLKIDLEESEGNFLKEIEITAKKPIIVKKDTIIYDIEHYTKTHDESLENVLAKIEGFKIKPDGSIEVNGKTIQKVLVDGKEVSDFGAGVITKSLSPDKVKSVEVRFDEKNKKIKESLLSDEKFVVLDIKLKEGVKKSFFGKQQLTSGYQTDVKVGGLTNLFSLNEQFNLQVFAENNNFGRNTIQLSQIKNIGAESMAKIFSLPIDIDDIKQRNGFNEEVYGFDNFVQNDNAIVGVSSNFVLSKKTDLYFGSFNNYQFIKNFSQNQLFFENFLINDFSLNSFFRDFNSKNKLQLKHTSNKFKITSDVNYSFQDAVNNNLVLNQFINNHNKFSKFSNWYANNFIEYEVNSKLGITSSFTYKNERKSYDFNFLTDNSLFNDIFGLNENFTQFDTNREEQLSKSIFMTYKAGVLGLNSLGFKYTNNHLENNKIANVDDFSTVQPFSTSATQKSIFHKLHHGFDKLSFIYDHELTHFEFPTFTNNTYDNTNSLYYQFGINLSYEFSQKSNLTALYTSKLDYFPLNKTTIGNTLIDFQTIFIPNQNLEPFYNKTFSLAFNKTFDNRTELDIAYLQGESNNLNNQFFESGFVLIQANQLQSKYHALSTTLKQRFKKLPLIVIYEPEFLSNRSEFLINNNIETTQSNRYFLGIKANYKISDNFSVFYFPKYSHFIFTNSLIDDQRDFNFLSNNLTLNCYFLEQKLMFISSFRQVNFIKNEDNFNNFDFQLVYKTQKWRYFLNFNNIFNSKNFITQDFNQNILNVNRNSVFGRFINIGIELKIN